MPSSSFRWLVVPWFALVGGCSLLTPVETGTDGSDASVVDAAGADAGTDAAVYPTDPGAACPSGVRPSLANCSAHDSLTADCGGTSDDTWFACSDTGCRLFQGGCVASGYDRLHCDLADPCCPGSELTATGGPIESWAFAFHQNFGRSIAALESAYVLDVVSTTGGSGSASITCPTPTTLPCIGDATVSALPAPYFDDVQGSRAIAKSYGLGYEGFVIDLLQTSSSAPKARVCAVTGIDYVAAGCSSSPWALRCATSGTVTWDGAGPGHAEVVIDGETWTLDF